jgi:polyisoprenoid-binding protein YceI
MLLSKRNEHGLVRWLINLIILGVIVVVAAPFIYFKFIQGDAPKKLSVENLPTITTVPGTARLPLAGTWKIAAGSTAGYRAKEQLSLGITQTNVAAGRTDKVSGSMTIAVATVTDASFTVDMASVASVANKIDGAIASRRDDQFRGRIMNTDQFPTAKFVLTKPIVLAPVPADSVLKSYSATGKLTLHGTTKTVTIPIKAQRANNALNVQGIVSITFSDYGIDDPSGGPATVGKVGQMEFALQFTKTSGASAVAPG